MEQFADLLRVGDIAWRDDGATAKLLDGRSGFARASFVAVHQHGMGAGFGQGDGHRPPKALGRAADEGDPAGEVEELRHGWVLKRAFRIGYRKMVIGYPSQLSRAGWTPATLPRAAENK